jgi:succinyl-CoA synthetase beta subunit
MKLHEFQVKSILAGYGVAVPRGRVAISAAEARAAAEGIGGPAVVKAQMLAGGRGLAGGVIRVAAPAEAGAAAERLLGRALITAQTGPAGRVIRRVLVEERLAIARELYLAVSLDREAARIAILASPRGGIDIESLASTDPGLIFKATIDPATGLSPELTQRAAAALDLAGPGIDRAAALVADLVRAFEANDASLIEINPLVLTDAGALVAADAKMEIDDNALFRHPDLAGLADPDEHSAAEAQAAAAGLSFIRLEGDVGCLVNGAGLAMATMDLVALAGGKPANFLDIGGAATEDAVAEAFALVTFDPGVRSALVNIFGGIVRCDLVARGIVRAARERGVRIPVVVRMEGTNVELGRAILAGSGLAFASAPDMETAASEAVRLARAPGADR